MSANHLHAQPTYGSYGQPAPPSYQPQQPGAAPVHPDSKDRFEYVKTGPKYHDVWATVLFVVHLLGFVVISGLGLSFLSENGLPSTTTADPNSGATAPPPIPENAGRMLVIILAVASLAGALLSGLYTIMMQKMGAALIKTMFVLSIAMYIGLGILGIILGSVVFAVIYFLLAGLWVLCFFWWRSRIPLAALIMSTVTQVAGKYVFAVLPCVFDIHL